MIGALFGQRRPGQHDFGQLPWRQRRQLMQALGEIAGTSDLNQLQQYVGRFELAFASRLGAAYAVGTASGTDALFLALQQAGVGPGSEVITVANTWITTITSIRELGATPVLVDIDPLTGMMDPARVADAITPATRVLLPVHMYGAMVPMPALIALARQHGLSVIEDCCQAIGASCDGRAAGTWGDAGCFSFFATKLVGAPGDGGMLLTQQQEFQQAVRHRATVQWQHAWSLIQARVPSRLSPLSIPFLQVRLQLLDQRIAARRRQWQRYAERLRDVPGCRLLAPAATVESSYRNCILITGQKSAVLDACRQHRLPIEEMYPASRAFVERLTDHQQALPHTLQLVGNSLSLPLGAHLSDRKIDQLATLVASCH